MDEVVINILQGSAVTQTMLGGLFRYISSSFKFPVSLVYIVPNRISYESWLAVDKGMLQQRGLTFWPTLHISIINLYGPTFDKKTFNKL